MELKQLEYFRHVAALRSFTRAAAFLSVVQPALSRQVRQLEIELGHFTLGLPPTLGRSVTVPLVKAFARQLPNARLATVEGLSAYVLEWLNFGRVDCALADNAPDSPLAPTLKTSLSMATSAQRPKNPLLRKAMDVVRDIVRREIRYAEVLT